MESKAQNPLWRLPAYHITLFAITSDSNEATVANLWSIIVGASLPADSNYRVSVRRDVPVIEVYETRPAPSTTNPSPLNPGDWVQRLIFQVQYQRSSNEGYKRGSVLANGDKGFYGAVAAGRKVRLFGYNGRDELDAAQRFVWLDDEYIDVGNESGCLELMRWLGFVKDSGWDYP
ncbi:hypothetical protein BDW74DRAFT_179179 [Aspergillus multicolor]|uniref:uncharacterized protein n=1 Tax=Aspergillus multicolor TaxID=41759 RepID=UPI003CCD789D